MSGSHVEDAGLNVRIMVVGDWCAEAGLAWENRPGFYGLGVVRIPALGPPSTG